MKSISYEERYTYNVWENILFHFRKPSIFETWKKRTIGGENHKSQCWPLLCHNLFLPTRVTTIFRFIKNRRDSAYKKLLRNYQEVTSNIEKILTREKSQESKKFFTTVNHSLRRKAVAIKNYKEQPTPRKVSISAKHNTFYWIFQRKSFDRSRRLHIYYCRYEKY